MFGGLPLLRNIKYIRIHDFFFKNSKIFIQEGPIKMFGGHGENVSLDLAVALDGPGSIHLGAFTMNTSQCEH